MREQIQSNGGLSEPTTGRTPGTESATKRSEDIHIRNYDMQRANKVTIDVRTPESQLVLSKQYHLQPGETRSEPDLLPNGAYELRVALDDGAVDSLQCRIGDSADQTAVVELGNGVLAVTEGIYQ